MRPADFQQKADHACGAACVRMIMDHFGMKPPSEKWLLKKLHARRDTGIEPLFIEMYLNSVGLKAEYVAEEKSLQALINRFDAGWKPIVCWSDWDGHYCVMVNESGRRLWLADPAAMWEDPMGDGLTTPTKERFMAMWRTPHTKRVREVIYVKERTK